jgi:hypothetical protein
MDNEHSGSMSSGSGAVTSVPADIAAEKTGLSAQAEAALSKVSETAQQAGNHVKEAATSLATEAGEKAKGFIDQQVASGADFLGYIGRSARVAAMGQGALAIWGVALVPLRRMLKSHPISQ